jgi:hypothetical protein
MFLYMLRVMLAYNVLLLVLVCVSVTEPFLSSVCCVRCVSCPCTWFTVDKEHGNLHRKETNTKKKAKITCIITILTINTNMDLY